MVKKKGVTPKIVETLAMWVLLKTFLLCIRQDHGLGCFASNADIIKVNRMVAFIFQGYNNYRIVRYFFINRYIYTEEEHYNKKADQYCYNYFWCFSHFL